ncbi:DNA replication/repair protein RecF [Thalassotalea mangrovi]|uniref:DNA replication and repair protein RecF n=1 Tax=Thalassotalea mangrovi TaxID=2572245 RepID=A0A4U1B7F5_9GAMM|nr:DNA replication/repair protein RecF [Thalassotalea mangrovi]TKB46413.1 DNA replication/repair protein RecF [Thalassotalea mangrovi]
MSIQKLYVDNFRNLTIHNSEFDPALNFILGDNGSGKSSLLESIFFLGHGKSFRTTKLENLVNREADKFTVAIKDDRDSQLGISRHNDGKCTIKLNGAPAYKLSEMAKHVAVQIITPETFKLFFGGPKERRRFVDLGMFHVEHQFAELWREFRRVLLQRNACLRTGVRGQQYEYWTELFVQQSEILAALRKQYVVQLSEELQRWLAILLPELSEGIALQYSRGWGEKHQLTELLRDCEDKERQYGYSSYGAQKFDVKFHYQKMSIDQVLSRGQQKMFLMALTVAQATLIFNQQQVRPIILIDDIGAELDTDSRQRLAAAIEQLQCQVFITAIEKSALEPIIPKHNKYKMFHVKHGIISEV